LLDFRDQEVSGIGSFNQQTQMHMEMLRESSQVPSYGVDLFPRLADHHLVLLNINLNMQVNL
jgi:hypothetical protein